MNILQMGGGDMANDQEESGIDGEGEFRHLTQNPINFPPSRADKHGGGGGHRSQGCGAPAETHQLRQSTGH